MKTKPILSNNFCTAFGRILEPGAHSYSTEASTSQVHYERDCDTSVFL